MNKYFYLIFYFTAITTVISQNNWVVFKSAPIPSKQIDNRVSYNIVINKNEIEKRNKSLLKLPSFIDEKYLIKTNTVPANFIACIIQDKAGNIWFGTFGGGLAKFDGKTWEVFNSHNSKLPSDIVYSLAADKNNSIWIGTLDGLANFDGSQWLVYNKNNSKLPSNMIYSIAVDINNNKWIGTTKGLVKHFGNSWRNFNTANAKIPNKNISALAVDYNDDLWIGTFEGLVKYDGINWRVIKKSNSPLPYNDIYSIYVDKTNKVYIGTWGGGLAIIDGNNWRVFNLNNSKLPDNYVSSVQHDHQNRIVVGTLSGFAIQKGKSWDIKVMNNSPITNNQIYSLLKDANGNIWIGTENGLIVHNENQSFESVSESEIKIDNSFSYAIKSNSHFIQNILNGFSNYNKNVLIESIIFDRLRKSVQLEFSTLKKADFLIELENPLNKNKRILKRGIADSGKHFFEFNLEKFEKSLFLLKIAIGDFSYISKVNILE